MIGASDMFRVNTYYACMGLWHARRTCIVCAPPRSRTKTALPQTLAQGASVGPLFSCLTLRGLTRSGANAQTAAASETRCTHRKDFSKQSSSQHTAHTLHTILVKPVLLRMYVLYELNSSLAIACVEGAPPQGGRARGPEQAEE